MKIPDKYYKVVDGKKIYFFYNKQIGSEFEMKKYLVTETKMSYSKATKELGKIKELKDEK